jgi:excisionase family DNA binding protein
VTERLLTAREVADELGVTPRTVLRWTRAGVLPGYRIGGRALRFRADEVDGWLEQRRTREDARATDHVRRLERNVGGREQPNEEDN